ncbi:unnamed protein product [Adineta steineri]|uniref:Uncharacterized protein n=2 Tax=Adineta steineri TaxID=433720 RepID=A0A815ESH4_9BILA|nr:unnamed protein product [Adineta steineri]CAF3567942.1 unnamed protein product [Adineta steineri]
MKGQKLTAENLRSTYLKVPLLSITEAIQQVPNSWTHLSFCPISLPPYITLPSGWTTNDLAAIKVYTSPCRLYDALNEALRTEKINEIRPWFSYLKLFDTAINKIPPVKRRYCRGIRVAPDSSYKIGTVITWVNGTVTVKSTTTTTSTSKLTSTPPLDFTAVLPLSTATSNER